MARNVEIKARLEQLEPYLARAESLASEPMQTIEQVDIFFLCDSGRLNTATLKNRTNINIRIFFTETYVISSWGHFPPSRPCFENEVSQRLVSLENPGLDVSV